MTCSCHSLGHPGCPACEFDPNKPVQTRDGKEARILATDLSNPPIAAWIAAGADHKKGVLYRYNYDGKISPSPTLEHPFDLVNVPERTEKFMNIYQSGAGIFYSSYEKAKNNMRNLPNFKGMIKLTYEDEKLISAELDKDC